MPIPAAAATRTSQISRPYAAPAPAGGPLGQSREGYGTNYPKITVEEPLRPNHDVSKLGFPERNISFPQSAYETPQRPIQYTEIPIERGLPVGRTNPQQGAQGNSGSSGGSGDYQRQPVSQGDGRFRPAVIFPQSDPRSPSNSAGFETQADWKAWQNGELTRTEAEREAAAGRWLGSSGFKNNGLQNDAGRPVIFPDAVDAYEAGNRWRVRNGLSPVGLDGQPMFKDGKMPDNGTRPTPYGPPIPDSWKNPEKKPFADPSDYRPISPFSPFSPPSGLNPNSDIDPATGAPIGDPNYTPSTRDPFAPNLPDLPANPFPPGSPGGAVDPGQNETNPVWRVVWNLGHPNPNARGRGPHTHFFSQKNAPVVAVVDLGPQVTGEPGARMIGLSVDGVIVSANGDRDFGQTFDKSFSGPTVVAPGTSKTDPKVQPFPPAQKKPSPTLGRPPSYQPGNNPAPGYTPQGSGDPSPSPSPSPSPAPGGLPLPAPAPTRKPAPLPLPLPFPAPGGSPARSPAPAPQPIGAPSPSPSPSPAPGSGSGSGSGSSPNPPPFKCNYKEDDTETASVDYVVVTPIGRLKTPRRIQVHEKMAEATKLQFEVLGQMRESLDKIEKNTKIAKVMHMVSMATTIHNAMMLSRELAETLGNVTSMTFTAVGRMTGLVGESDFVNINEILGGQFNEFMERTLGKELWSGTKESWLKASRIYQSGANIVNSVRDIADSTRDIGEFTAQNVSKIGNALKKYRVVGWDAYGTMDEDARAKSKFFRSFDKAIEKGERLENAASSLGGVSGNVLSIQDEVKEIKENREAFQKGIAEWGKKDEAKQKKDEAASKVDETIEEKDLK